MLSPQRRGKICTLMRLGVHVSIAGGIQEAVVRATRLSCTTMQIFSRSPRGGTAAPLSPSDCQRFDAERRAADLEPLAVHAPYIINLASPEATMWTRSVALYRDEYARATALNAQYLVTHVGSHRGAGEAAGIARVARAMTQTLAGRPQRPALRGHLDGGRSAGDAPTTMILLENTAGSGQGLGMTFEELAAIRDAIRPKRYVGICLDTAHLFAAGFPIHTEKGLEQVVASFDRIVGREHLKLIHLNDSKVPFDSRVDRHWHIGQGHIGLAAFRRIVNHPQLKDLPFILETPKHTDTDDLKNLATVRKLRNREKDQRGHTVTRGRTTSGATRSHVTCDCVTP